MKKLVFSLMAVAAIMLTSCFGKTEAPGQGDAQAEAPSEVSDLGAALQSQLSAGNGEGLFALVSNIQEKAMSFIKDNPAKAKEYLGTAQKFLKDNAAAIGELVGKISNSDMATRAQEVIKSVSEQPVDQLLGLVGAVDGAAEGLQDAAADKVDEAKDAIEEKVGEVKDAAADKVNEAKDAMDKVKGAVDEKVNQAKDVVDKANDVKDAVGGLLGR